MNDNYDLQELSQFNALGSDWWSSTGPLKTLHQLNPLRLQYIQQRIPLANLTVIDVGCGGGILAESMANHGAHVTGIDLSEAAIHAAQQHQKQTINHIEYLCTTAETIAIERPHHYDVVTCMEMLEHVPDPMMTIRSCAQLVKPTGHLFFSTLNRHFKSYLYAILGAEYLCKLLPIGTHDYGKFIRPSELSNWLRKAKLVVKDVQGIVYQPLLQRFKFTTDISVNYLIYARN